jgi:cysteinyl-tRNA synthetase
VTASLFLYDTASGKKVPFGLREPGRACPYTSDPTVCRHVHIGNLKTCLHTDLLGDRIREAGSDVVDTREGRNGFRKRYRERS